MQANKLQSGLSRLGLSNVSITLALSLTVCVITVGLSGCDAGQLGGELLDAGTLADSGVTCNSFLCEEGKLHAWTGQVFGQSCDYSNGISRTCEFGCNAERSECAGMPDTKGDAGHTADAGTSADIGLNFPDAQLRDTGTSTVTPPMDGGVICTLACMNTCATDNIHLVLVTGCATDNTCHDSGNAINCGSTPGGVCRVVNGAGAQCVLETDAGVVADAGNPADASLPTDTGVLLDSGGVIDGGVVDSGTSTVTPPNDAGSNTNSDTGGALDSSDPDASGVDASVSDAGGNNDAATGLDAAVGDLGIPPPVCTVAGQAPLRDVCVSPVGGCWPFIVHCVPGIAMTTYTAAVGDPGTFGFTSTTTPSLLYPGLTETVFNHGTCSVAFSGQALSTFCVDETVRGYSLAADLHTDPNGPILGAIHNTIGSLSPVADRRDAGAPD